MLPSRRSVGNASSASGQSACPKNGNITCHSPRYVSNAAGRFVKMCASAQFTSAHLPYRPHQLQKPRFSERLRPREPPRLSRPLLQAFPSPCCPTHHNTKPDFVHSHRWARQGGSTGTEAMSCASTIQSRTPGPSAVLDHFLPELSGLSESLLCLRKRTLAVRLRRCSKRRAEAAAVLGAS